MEVLSISKALHRDKSFVSFYLQSFAFLHLVWFLTFLFVIFEQNLSSFFNLNQFRQLFLLPLIRIVIKFWKVIDRSWNFYFIHFFIFHFFIARNILCQSSLFRFWSRSHSRWLSRQHRLITIIFLYTLVTFCFENIFYATQKVNSVLTSRIKFSSWLKFIHTWRSKGLYYFHLFTSK